MIRIIQDEDKRKARVLLARLIARELERGKTYDDLAQTFTVAFFPWNPREDIDRVPVQTVETLARPDEPAHFSYRALNVFIRALAWVY